MQVAKRDAEVVTNQLTDLKFDMKLEGISARDMPKPSMPAERVEARQTLERRIAETPPPWNMIDSNFINRGRYFNQLRDLYKMNGGDAKIELEHLQALRRQWQAGK